MPMDLSNIPDVEGVLVALRATIDALWALATDAATDIDISSADGTTVPRSQRYRQLREQIDGLTARYNHIAAMLNVGLDRIEMSKIANRGPKDSSLENRLQTILDRDLDDDDLDDIDDLPDSEVEDIEENVVDAATAAQTVAELEQALS